MLNDEKGHELFKAVVTIRDKNRPCQEWFIKLVNESIVRMDEVTQQNAAMVEEAVSTAQSMHNKADNVVNDISVFKLGDGHKPDYRHSGHRPRHMTGFTRSTITPNTALFALSAP